MKLKMIANALTSKVGRQLLMTQKHSPTILLAAGVVGMGATIVLASRATLKLEKVVTKHEEGVFTARTLHEQNREDYTDNDYRRDMVVIHTQYIVGLAKLYAPAVVMGLASVAALTGGHVILNRRNTAVMAAYAALQKGFVEYRKRVVDQYGDEKDQELRHGLVDKDIYEDDEDGGMVRTIKALGEKKGSIYSVFFDERSTSWSRAPHYNQTFLSAQQNYMNNLLQSRGHVFLNEVYDALGLPRTTPGAVVGWVKGQGDNFVDFGVFRGDIYMGQEFVNGNERSILLDFNVDGVIYDKI